MVAAKFLKPNPQSSVKGTIQGKKILKDFSVAFYLNLTRTGALETRLRGEMEF